MASEQPHLACIIPWEGTVDYYADFCYPGGIQANGFLSFWWENGVLTHQYNPGGSLSEEQLQDNRIDFPEMVKNNPLRDQSWTNRFSDLSKVEVPLLSASNWFSAGMHTRGTFWDFRMQHRSTSGLKCISAAMLVNFIPLRVVSCRKIPRLLAQRNRYRHNEGAEGEACHSPWR